MQLLFEAALLAGARTTGGGGRGATRHTQPRALAGACSPVAPAAVLACLAAAAAACFPSGGGNAKQNASHAHKLHGLLSVGTSGYERSCFLASIHAGGFMIESPKDFAQRIYAMMAPAGASGASGGDASQAAETVEPEVL